MDGTDIKIGTKLEITIHEIEGIRDSITCISQLLEVIDTELLIIANPIYESKYVLVPSDSEVDVIFFDHRKGLFTFPGQIVGRTKDHNVLALQMKITGDIIMIQRRNFYRLDHILYTNYRVLGKNVTKQAITKNLSGGGVCISIHEKIEKGEELELSITLDNNLKFNSICQVVRCEEIEQPKHKRFDIGLRFTKISCKDQEAIVKYVFEKQRLQINR